MRLPLKRDKPPFVIFPLRLPLKRDKNDMVSQMARAKNLGEPFMARLENLYNIPCSHNQNIKSLSNKIIETFRDCFLQQVILENTRGRRDNIPRLLDLVLCNML